MSARVGKADMARTQGIAVYDPTPNLAAIRLTYPVRPKKLNPPFTKASLREIPAPAELRKDWIDGMECR